MQWRKKKKKKQKQKKKTISSIATHPADPFYEVSEERKKKKKKKNRILHYKYRPTEWPTDDGRCSDAVFKGFVEYYEFLSAISVGRRPNYISEYLNL